MEFSEVDWKNTDLAGSESANRSFSNKGSVNSILDKFRSFTYEIEKDFSKVKSGSISADGLAKIRGYFVRIKKDLAQIKNIVTPGCGGEKSFSNGPNFNAPISDILTSQKKEACGDGSFVNLKIKNVVIDALSHVSWRRGPAGSLTLSEGKKIDSGVESQIDKVLKGILSLQASQIADLWQNSAWRRVFFTKLLSLAKIENLRDKFDNFLQNVEKDKKLRILFEKTISDMLETEEGSLQFKNLLVAARDVMYDNSLLNIIYDSSRDEPGLFIKILANLRRKRKSVNLFWECVALSLLDGYGGQNFKEFLDGNLENHRNLNTFFEFWTDSIKTPVGLKNFTLLFRNIRVNTTIRNRIMFVIAKLNETPEGRDIFIDFINALVANKQASFAFFEHINKMCLNRKMYEYINNFVEKIRDSEKSKQAFQRAILLLTSDTKGKLLLSGILRNEILGKFLLGENFNPMKGSIHSVINKNGVGVHSMSGIGITGIRGPAVHLLSLQGVAVFSPVEVESADKFTKKEQPEIQAAKSLNSQKNLEF